MPYSRISESSNHQIFEESFALQLFYDGCLLLFIYIVLVPLLSYIFNINITRSIAIECTLYVKFMQWLYKYVLPSFGHGMKNYTTTNNNNNNSNNNNDNKDDNNNNKK